MLLSVMFRAHLETLSAKKQQRFVRSVMQTFEEMERAGTVVRLRSPKYDAEVLKARREALAWVRGAMAAAWQLDALKGPPR
jgi:cytochrome c556